MYICVYIYISHILRKCKGRPDTDGWHLGAICYGQMPTVPRISNLGVALTAIVSGSSTMTNGSSVTILTLASALSWRENSPMKLLVCLYEQMGICIEVLSVSLFQWPCTTHASISVLIVKTPTG